VKKVKSVTKSKSVKPAVKKSKPKEIHGKVVSITELYEMKKAKEKEKAEAAEAFKNKKDLPPHEEGPRASEDVPHTDLRKAGFGGARHK
jgi:hypothetical protein